MTINLISVKNQFLQIKNFNNRPKISFSARKNDDIFQRSVVFTEEEYNKNENL